MDVAVEAQLYAALGSALMNDDPRAAWHETLAAFEAIGLIDADAAQRWTARVEPEGAAPSEAARERARAHAERLVEEAREREGASAEWSDPGETPEDWLGDEDDTLAEEADPADAAAEELAALRAVGLISAEDEVDLLDRLVGMADDGDEEESLGDLRAVVTPPDAALVTVAEIWTGAVVIRHAGDALDSPADPWLSDDRGTTYELLSGAADGVSGHWTFAPAPPADATKLTYEVAGRSVDLAVIA